MRKETSVGSSHTHQWPQAALAQIDAGDEHADGEDEREVDRHVGAQVVASRSRVRRCWMPMIPPKTKPHERDDRHRHVEVEDLLDEALVGVVGA